MKIVLLSVGYSPNFFYDLYMAARERPIEIECATEEDAKVLFEGFSNWYTQFTQEYPSD